MSNIVRAWKDETYRQSLSTEEQAMLPASPAGEIELTEAQLEAAFGGWGGYGGDGDCYGDGRAAMRPRRATNEIDQDVDVNQRIGNLTYNNTIVFATVKCTARNEVDVDQDVNTKKGFCY